jgi:hypothetical protein
MGNEQPVGTGTTIAAALIVLVNSAVAMLTAMGVVHWDTGAQAAINAFVVALINVAAIVVPMIWVHRQVTSLAAPKDEDGVPLVRANSDNAPTLSQTRSMLKK